ncbi:MAG: exosortase/archaeosortase family protein [Polyangiaceae bacterium]
MKLPRGIGRDLALVAAGLALFGLLYTPLGQYPSEPLREVAYRGALTFLDLAGEAYRAAPAKHLISSPVHPSASIAVTLSCSGLRAVALWAAFVAFVPIRYKTRAIHFLLGAALLLAINVVRLGHLYYLQVHDHAHFEIYHEWLWPAAKVAVIVAYWAILMVVSWRAPLGGRGALTIS